MSLDAAWAQQGPQLSPALSLPGPYSPKGALPLPRPTWMTSVCSGHGFCLPQHNCQLLWLPIQGMPHLPPARNVSPPPLPRCGPNKPKEPLPHSLETSSAKGPQVAGTTQPPLKLPFAPWALAPALCPAPIGTNLQNASSILGLVFLVGACFLSPTPAAIPAESLAGMSPLAYLQGNTLMQPLGWEGGGRVLNEQCRRPLP